MNDDKFFYSVIGVYLVFLVWVAIAIALTPCEQNAAYNRVYFTCVSDPQHSAGQCRAHAYKVMCSGR